MHRSNGRSKAALLLLLAVSPAHAQTVDRRDGTELRVLSLGMEEAVAFARVRSFRLQRILRNDELSQLRLSSAKAQTGPRADLSANVSQAVRYYDSRTGVFGFTSTDPTFFGGLVASVSLPIDISGVQHRQIEQARLSREASELDLSQGYIDIAAEIRSFYVEALRAQEEVEADEALVARIEGLIARLGPGRTDLIAYLSTERANAVQVREAAAANAEIVQTGLKQALRLPPDVQLRLTSRLPEPRPLPDVAAILDQAYRQRIDLQQAEIRIEQARLAQKQATDYRKPSLFASAYATQSLSGELPFRDPDRNRFRSVGGIVNLNVPLVQYDGGILFNAKRSAQIQLEQAEADLDEQRERVETEIRQVMIGLNRARSRLDALPDVAQALESLARAEAALLAASAEQAPALLAQATNARASWRSAVTASIGAKADYYSSLFRLQRSVGIADGDFGAPVKENPKPRVGPG